MSWPVRKPGSGVFAGTSAVWKALFAHRTEETLDGCWKYLWCTNRAGYGKLGSGYKVVLAHRKSLELCVGPIGENKMVCHRCDNPPCINPKHLFIGTQLENIRDASKKKRLRTGESNHFSRISNADRENIIRLIASGTKQIEVAKLFGITQSGVSKFLTRRSSR